MPTTDALEIMQLAVDGEATPEQEAQLREFLNASPELRATYEALRGLARELDAVPLLDPPGIRRSVLSQLRPSRGMPLRSRRNVVLAFAYAAAAVIIVGVVVHRAIPPAKDSAATMVRPEVEDWPLIARAASAEAKITVRRNGDQFLVDVSGAGQGPCLLQWDGRKLAPPEGRAAFQKRPVQLRLQRRAGASGPAVIALQLPDRPDLRATIDLH
jgi:hypothetical protein